MTSEPKPVLKIKLLSGRAIKPSYGSDQAAGLDLSVVARVDPPGGRPELPNVEWYTTDIAVSPSAGYHTELIPRSSIVFSEMMMANGIGVIDKDYRGAIMVPLRKMDLDAPLLKLPARVVQLVLRKTYRPNLKFVEDLSETKRGAGGFGSTG